MSYNSHTDLLWVNFKQYIIIHCISDLKALSISAHGVPHSVQEVCFRNSIPNVHIFLVTLKSLNGANPFYITVLVLMCMHTQVLSGYTTKDTDKDSNSGRFFDTRLNKSVNLIQLQHLITSFLILVALERTISSNSTDLFKSCGTKIRKRKNHMTWWLPLREKRTQS